MSAVRPPGLNQGDAGAVAASCWRRPPRPLVAWRRPLSPVVNRDVKVSRRELTARSPGSTTVAEGAQNWGVTVVMLTAAKESCIGIGRGRNLGPGGGHFHLFSDPLAPVRVSPDP